MGEMMRHGTCEGTTWLISHGKVIGSGCAQKWEAEDQKWNVGPSADGPARSCWWCRTPSRVRRAAIKNPTPKDAAKKIPRWIGMPHKNFFWGTDIIIPPPKHVGVRLHRQFSHPWWTLMTWVTPCKESDVKSEIRGMQCNTGLESRLIDRLKISIIMNNILDSIIIWKLEKCWNYELMIELGNIISQ